MKARLFFALFGLLLLSGCMLLRGYEALLVLADIAARNQPSLLKETSPRPSRKAVMFEVSGRNYRADLYQSPEGSLAGIVLVPGAAERGKDDPRLVAFAATLARARFAVLVPDLASLRSLRVSPDNIEEVSDCFIWLVGNPELAPQGRAGMVAFSYAAGPVLLAALEPPVRDRVQFVYAVGGYYDLEEVLIFFTTGYFRENGRWKYMEPNEYGKWVFVLSNIQRLRNSADRKLLTLMAERKLLDLDADIEDLAVKLGSEGKKVFSFITNGDPDQGLELLGDLPDAVRNDIEALNLARYDLKRLRARLILVHGFDDNIIPYVQSKALAQAAPEGQTRCFLADGLAHVTLKPDLISRWRLWRAVDALLYEREAPQMLDKPASVNAIGT